jgi:hypothetical protein
VTEKLPVRKRKICRSSGLFVIVKYQEVDDLLGVRNFVSVLCFCVTGAAFVNRNAFDVENFAV